MTTRKKFIASLPGGFLLLSSGLSEINIIKPQKPSLGLLLGTVEKYMRDDPAEILQKIAAMGFTELEYPSNYGHPVGELKSMITANNLRSLGGGDNITRLTNYFSDYVREYNLMNKKYVFCYWPWFDDGKNKTIEDWQKQSDVLNKLGEKYKEAGLRLAYHNHNIEFVNTNGQIPYDVLLKNLNAEWITFEMDIWWIYKGGKDPMDFINQYPGRFEVCHIKPAGLLFGTEEIKNLDFEKVVKAGDQAGFQHMVLENEPGIENPILYLEKGYSYLKSLLAE